MIALDTEITDYRPIIGASLLWCTNQHLLLKVAVTCPINDDNCLKIYP